MERRNRNLIISSIIAVIVALIANITYLITSVVPGNYQVATYGYAVFAIITSIAALGFGIVQVLDTAKRVRAKKTEVLAPSIKIRLELDGEPITIETSDTERVEEILKMVQSLQTHQQLSSFNITETPLRGESEER
jgi:hypothetical protein